MNKIKTCSLLAHIITMEFLDMIDKIESPNSQLHDSKENLELDNHYFLDSSNTLNETKDNDLCVMFHSSESSNFINTQKESENKDIVIPSVNVFTRKRKATPTINSSENKKFHFVSVRSDKPPCNHNLTIKVLNVCIYIYQFYEIFTTLIYETKENIINVEDNQKQGSVIYIKRSYLLKKFPLYKRHFNQYTKNDDGALKIKMMKNFNCTCYNTIMEFNQSSTAGSKIIQNKKTFFLSETKIFEKFPQVYKELAEYIQLICSVYK